MKTYRIRLYPTKIQAEFFDKSFGCTRFVYNWGLEKKNEAYQKDGTRLSYFDLTNMLPALKVDNEWLTEPPSQSLQMALRSLDNAFTAFFKKSSSFPRFKSKRSGRNIFRIPQGVWIKDNRIKLSKAGPVKFRSGYNLQGGNIKTVSVVKDPDGKYYCLVKIDEVPAQLPVVDDIIGIDVGIKTFVTTSNGDKFYMPSLSEKNIKRHQRQLAKKIKGSNRYNKERVLLAKSHKKLVNIRDDFQHKLSTKLIRENQTVVVEDLDVKRMVKNKRLAHSIHACAWSGFMFKLEYKANWYGRNFRKIGRFDPSSKMCSCGRINQNLTLKDRNWTCTSCGETHDRDVLAARNILKFGLEEAVVER